jgi:hypothetical protein
MKTIYMCIGFGKTGTVSLTRAFSLLGLEMSHHCKNHNSWMKQAINEGKPILTYFPKKFDGFSDGDLCDHYKEMDEQYDNTRK